MFFEYIILFKYFIFCVIVSFALFYLSLFLVYQDPSIEKYSSYECGFNPFSDARTKFEVHFIFVGILFIIFDLEIAFLVPFIFVIDYISFFGVISITLFLIILTLGFLYELALGILDFK